MSNETAHRRIDAARAVGALALAAAVAGAPALLGSTAAQADGALAINGNHGSRYGFSHDYRDSDAADERALSECGAGCRVIIRFRNTCAAYAADTRRGSNIYGWARNDTGSAAQRSAIRNCENQSNSGDAECEVRVWGCDGQ